MKFLQLIFMLMSIVEHASGVSFEENQVTLSAVKLSNEESPGIIRCTISNQSPFTLASVNLQTHSSEFQFELLDSSGNTVPQDAKWSNDYAQKGSPRYEKPRASMAECIFPGKKIEFDLNLKEAYGNKLEQGKILKVSWVNIWEAEFDESEWMPSNGTEMPRNREKFHFPNPRWELSVSLPLQPKSEVETDSPANNQVILPLQPDDRPKQTDTSKPRPTPDNLSTDSLSHNIGTTPNPLWWALLVFPVTFIVWLVSRRKKKK